MSMFFSGQDDDEAYAEDQKDRGMFTTESRDEWQARRDRAREIMSGFYMLRPFEEDDEELLKEICKMRDAEW